MADLSADVRANGAAMPLVAVTGYVGAAKLSEVSSAFDHVLPKPLDVDKLLGLLLHCT